MKKIVIATDSYKECMDGIMVAQNIKTGFSKVYPNANYYCTAIADGGEGTTEVLVATTKGQTIKFASVDGLNRPISSFLGLNEDKTIAYLEMAASAGIELISPNDRDPLTTTSRGVGIMIKEALKQDVTKIIIGIGGSVTNDLGAGMLYELGMKFFDENQRLILPCGGNLQQITSIDTGQLIDLSKIEIEVACDVDNPLYGPQGATYTYGRQKGANDETIKLLEQNIIHLAKLFEKTYQIDPQTISGGGAAGGLGAALVLCLKAKIRPGIMIVSDLLNIEAEIKTADLVITGEGRMDGQSINGKGPIGIAKLAHKHQVPCLAICGSLGADIEITYGYHITAAYSTMMQAESLQEAFKHTEHNLQLTASAIARTLAIKSPQ